MKITIIAASEKRRRYKFISVPLAAGGHEITIIQMRPFAKYLVEMFKLSAASEKQDLVILMGIGLKGLLMVCVTRLKGIHIMVRLGGDPVKDRKSQAASALKCRQYINWLTHKMNELLARFFLIRFSGGIVVNSTSLARRLSASLNKNQQIFVVPQFCEGDAVLHDYSMGKAIELLTVTNLAFAAKAKGVIWIIEQLICFSRDTDMEINFRVAGGGQHLFEIEEYLAGVELPVNFSVFLEGFVTGLEAWYTRANIFLYHSNHDALPNVILESKKYGIPLMANDCEEFRDVIRHLVSGVLYAGSTDFQVLLRKLVKHEKLRQDLGRAAIIEHEKEYSIRAIQEILENTVLRYLSQGREPDAQKYL